MFKEKHTLAKYIINFSSTALFNCGAYPQSHAVCQPVYLINENYNYFYFSHLFMSSDHQSLKSILFFSDITNLGQEHD